MSVGGEHIDTHEKNVEKGLANVSETDYNALKCESETLNEQSITQTGNAGERSQNDEFSIRAERGLSDTDVTDGQAAGGYSDEVRTDEEEVLTGEQERSLYGTASEGQTERTPAFDTGTGRAENGTSDRADDGESRSDGTAQGGQSDALGADDEQHQTLSGGNRTDGVDLQIKYRTDGSLSAVKFISKF